jgi:hypothetical protein
VQGRNKGRPEVGGGPDRWSLHVSERGGREEAGGRWAVWAEREGESHKEKNKREEEERWAGPLGRERGLGVWFSFLFFQILFKQLFKPLLKSNLLHLFHNLFHKLF